MRSAQTRVLFCQADGLNIVEVVETVKENFETVPEATGSLWDCDPLQNTILQKGSLLDFTLGCFQLQ